MKGFLLTGSIGHDTRKRERFCGLYISQALWRVKVCHTLRCVSNSIWLSLNAWTYGRIVVKQYNSRADFFGKDDRFEDSDYEGEADPSGNSAAEEGASSLDGQSNKETLPILTMGSFPR